MTKMNKIIYSYDLQWFAGDGPGGEKTEPATAKKLGDARNDGKVSKSMELNHAFNLIVLFLVLKGFMAFVSSRLLNTFPYVYNRIPEFVKINSKSMTSQAISAFLWNIIMDMLEIMFPFFAFGFSIVILVEVLQVGWKVTSKPMKPDFNKFNPINGLKRIVSKDSLFELVKSLFKIGLITYVGYTSVIKNADELFLLYDIPLMQAIILCGKIILDTGLQIALIYLFIGIADFAYQKHKFKEDMKMSKQEVKDEYKNTEGNPEIKGRQKQRMREASQRRMMQDVPKADVIITNPTHLAVALKYDTAVTKAPVVVAKGEDHLAMKIRDIAKENNIEIIENKPLARMLYANVDIGQEIPPELYQAVAEVLAMVYNLKNK